MIERHPSRRRAFACVVTFHCVNGCHARNGTLATSGRRDGDGGLAVADKTMASLIGSQRGRGIEAIHTREIGVSVALSIAYLTPARQPEQQMPHVGENSPGGQRMYATSAIPAHNYQRPTWGKPNTGYEGRRRMAEDRAGYTTGSPADATDAGQAEPTQNISAFPQRTWTQVDNSYYDRVLGKVSMAAWGVLSYFHRYALGYHRTDVRVSVNEIARLLGMALHTTQKALKELEDLGLLASDANERKRTQARTYILLPMTDWRIPLATAKTAVADTETSIEATAINDVVDDVTTAKTAVADGQTTAKIAPLIKKERKKEQIKRKQIDTSVSSVADSQRASDELTTPKAKSSPRTRKAEQPPRELTPDHQYRVDLLAAIAEARGGKERNHGADWKAAGDFYTMAEGTPLIERVVAWYREEMQRPKWDTGYPDLHPFGLGSYRAYVRSEENYRQAIVRARLAADGKLGQQGDHNATTYRASAANAYAGRGAARSATQQPDPHKDGIYAAFVD